MNRLASVRTLFTAALAAALLLGVAQSALADSMTLSSASGPSPAVTLAAGTSEGIGDVTVSN